MYHESCQVSNVHHFNLQQSFKLYTTVIFILHVREKRFYTRLHSWYKNGGESDFLDSKSSFLTNPTL